MYGRNNMPEVAFLASHLLWMMTREDVGTLYGMITDQAAAAMNLSNYGLMRGHCANLVVLGHRDVVDVLRFHDAPSYVISNGRIVDSSKFRQMAGVQMH
jgi:cytosine/creatinine deaminase